MKGPVDLLLMGAVKVELDVTNARNARFFGGVEAYLVTVGINLRSIHDSTEKGLKVVSQY